MTILKIELRYFFVALLKLYFDYNYQTLGKYPYFIYLVTDCAVCDKYKQHICNFMATYVLRPFQGLHHPAMQYSDEQKVWIKVFKHVLLFNQKVRS